MEKRFGFSKADNLLLAACYGFTYMVSASRAGRLAHRLGYFRLLRLGFAGHDVALLLGGGGSAWPGLFTRGDVYSSLRCSSLWTVGTSLVGRRLQALLSREAPSELPRIVGIYNLIWAARQRGGLFTGGVSSMDHRRPEICSGCLAVFMSCELFLLGRLAKARRPSTG